MIDGEEEATILDLVKNPRRPVDLTNFRRNLTKWIVVSRQAFLVIEEPCFREMISGLSMDAAEILPKSSNTTRNWTVKEFKRQKTFLMERFTQSRSRIHLSMDIWTTPTRDRSYLGIVGNWVDADFEIQNTLIALPAIEGQHTGTNIAEVTFNVTENYGISKQIGYCMLDSATNNDTALDNFHSLLVSNYGEEAIPIQPTERRLRCIGHIINLAAKSLLFGSDIEAFEFESNTLTENDLEIESEFQRWRQVGTIGKLHNLVTFIHRSTQRKEAFRSIQLDVLKWPHSILPHTDNATRWNSVFLMLNDGLNLREPIELYISMSRSSKTMEKKDKQRLEKHCTLNEDEWEELIHLHVILYDFWELTLRMQGNVATKMRENKLNTNPEFKETVYGKHGEHIFGKPEPKASAISTSQHKLKKPETEDGALFNVLPAYDHLLSKLEKAKKTYANNPRFATCINLAWKKMDEYYQKSDISKVYLVAAVLDPRVKMRYFEQNWPAEWLVDARENLDLYVKEFFSVIQISKSVEDDVSSVSIDVNDTQESNPTFGSWRQCDEDVGELTGIAREWKLYLESARVKDYRGFSVRHWWIVHRDQFPLLSEVALETLAIPAMSTEVERVFSGYKIPL